jgi:hypothetical protein
LAGTGEREEKPAKHGVFACFTGDSSSSGAGIRTPDTRIMIPSVAIAKDRRSNDLRKVENPVTGSVTGSPGTQCLASSPDDHETDDSNDLDVIVETIRRLPDADQAEVFRRLGDLPLDAGLGDIIAAWPKLSPTVRAGVVSAVVGFATG